MLTLAEQTQLAGQTAAILAKGTLAPQTVQDALAAALGDTARTRHPTTAVAGGGDIMTHPRILLVDDNGGPLCPEPALAPGRV